MPASPRTPELSALEAGNTLPGVLDDALDGRFAQAKPTRLSQRDFGVQIEAGLHAGDMQRNSTNRASV